MNKKIDWKWYNKKTKDLFSVILKLKSQSEAKRFFRDLFTKDEIKEFSNRWQAVKMLNKNIPYSTIRGYTGLSSATIARISNWMKFGRGGYNLMLKKLNIKINHHHTPKEKRL
jgi:TrpR-related protein YerC/YecD